MHSRTVAHDPPPTGPAWAGAVREVEEEGLCLAVEAMHRFNESADAALSWLARDWQSNPDETQRAIRDEAVRHINAWSLLDAQRLAAVA